MTCEPHRERAGQMFREEIHVTGFTRLVTFASLITVVAAGSAGASDAAWAGSVSATSQVADARA